MVRWIKICGLTRREDVETAIAAGVDAIGFVFAPSKRQVTARHAAQIASEVPAGIARIAVMLHPGQPLLDEVWQEFRPDVLQTDAEDLQYLAVPAELSVMPVLRTGRGASEILPPRLLFEGPVSGRGTTADWSAAAELAKRTQLVLAGGLNAANVAAAIDAVKPFGVDVSSGVESAPGVKDAVKIHEFVQAARG